MIGLLSKLTSPTPLQRGGENGIILIYLLLLLFCRCRNPGRRGGCARSRRIPRMMKAWFYSMRSVTRVVFLVKMFVVLSVLTYQYIKNNKYPKYSENRGFWQVQIFPRLSATAEEGARGVVMLNMSRRDTSPNPLLGKGGGVFILSSIYPHPVHALYT